MNVALVGPELEENLGLRYLHSAITSAGHEARIIEFHAPEQIESITGDITRWRPDMVGLSMVFTARAREFVDLASLLRGRGFTGRIVAGGHFASFHALDLLKDHPAFDVIVHGEGELTLVDLLKNINSPRQVAGISFRDGSGAVMHTPSRPNPVHLDILPPPTRTPPFYTYMGLPIANILSSRGCLGNCTFCSITAWYRQNKGPRLRQRNVSAVVFEMARLYHCHGVRIFNFHDDTFFHPEERLNIERFSAMEHALQSRAMTDIAIQVKARTDSITPPVLEVLRRIGLFRVFLGVENHSNDGLKSLGKGTTVEQNRRALHLLRAEKLHVTFNLLMFGPDTTIAQLKENIECIREFSDMPINFGRVEVYSGTPLERGLRAQRRLKGDIFGYHYDIRDRRVQSVFEAFRTVFTERNFQVSGMNFLGMKLDYYHQILAHFYPHRADEALFREKRRLLARLNRSNADLLQRLCEDIGADDESNRRLVQGLLQVRRSDDRNYAREFSALIREIEHRARQKKESSALSTRKAAVLSAAAAALLLSSQQCARVPSGESNTNPLNPPDTLDRHAVLPQLDSNEVALVEQRINSIYKTGIDSIGVAAGFTNRSLLFNLGLDSNGNVDSCDILQPARDSAGGFADTVAARILSWKFPDIKRSGACSITMVVAPLDTSWHICEIIGYPLDTIPQYPVDSFPQVTLDSSFQEYDSVDFQLVRNKFYSDYMRTVDSLCRKYGCRGKSFSICLSIDSAGDVAKSSVVSTGADSIPDNFIVAVTGLAGIWKFPGVSRRGACTINEMFFTVDPIIYEIMAFPQDTLQ
jgi:anaerobic magnesium-protoporphyrin IX monomethyl ester cyclase